MSHYAYAQLMWRIGVLMQEAKTAPGHTSVPKASWGACLRYFAAAASVANVVLLTTTPDGQIHARLKQGQEIIDLYF